MDDAHAQRRCGSCTRRRATCGCWCPWCAPCAALRSNRCCPRCSPRSLVRPPLSLLLSIYPVRRGRSTLLPTQRSNPDDDVGSDDRIKTKYTRSFVTERRVTAAETPPCVRPRWEAPSTLSTQRACRPHHRSHHTLGELRESGRRIPPVASECEVRARAPGRVPWCVWCGGGDGTQARR